MIAIDYLFCKDACKLLGSSLVVTIILHYALTFLLLTVSQFIEQQVKSSRPIFLIQVLERVVIHLGERQNAAVLLRLTARRNTAKGQRTGPGVHYTISFRIVLLLILLFSLYRRARGWLLTLKIEG